LNGFSPRAELVAAKHNVSSLVDSLTRVFPSTSFDSETGRGSGKKPPSMHRGRQVPGASKTAFLELLFADIAPAAGSAAERGQPTKQHTRRAGRVAETHY
jgi:hypothetical protein